MGIICYEWPFSHSLACRVFNSLSAVIASSYKHLHNIEMHIYKLVSENRSSLGCCAANKNKSNQISNIFLNLLVRVTTSIVEAATATIMH